MRKLLVMATMAIMTAMSVNAQNEGKIYSHFRIGGNISTLNGSNDAKMKLGWTIGTGLDFNFTDQWAVCLDISYNHIGAKSKAFDKNMNLEYINVGPMVKYHIIPWMALEAGPEIGFLISAKMDGTSYKSTYKKTVFSLPIGLSFEPKVNHNGNSLIVDLRYHLDLLKANERVIADDLRNSALILTVGYKFTVM